MAIFGAALEAADPGACIRRSLELRDTTLRVVDRDYPIDRLDRLVVIGAGKATPAMAAAAEEILGERISSGAINTKYGHAIPLDRIETAECGHPLPDQAGVDGTARILEQLQGLTDRSLVLALFSGGGSALMPAPAPGISLAEKQAATASLLGCGATIDEINTVRKHLSGTKGGLLARRVHPAQMACLLLSDVIGDPLDAIASGPTHPDSTTFDDCLQLISRYDIVGQLPQAVVNRLEEGAAGRIYETPKELDPCFESVRTRVIGNNALALSAARIAAEELGYHTLVISSRIRGESREVAAVHAAIGQEIRRSGQPLQPPACVISGGETTVSLKGDGKGGRNQEFALAAAVALAGWEDITVLSGGTDGTDGPTDAAGAIADGSSVARGQALGMAATAYLDGNDSYTYFAALDDLIVTGPTGTNVMDLQLIMVP